MIKAFKSEELIHKFGGRFKLTALIQKRWVELLNGSRPMVERGSMSDLELIIQEIIEGKLSIDYAKSDIDEVKDAGRAERAPSKSK